MCVCSRWNSLSIPLRPVTMGGFPTNERKFAQYFAKWQCVTGRIFMRATG